MNIFLKWKKKCCIPKINVCNLFPNNTVNTNRNVIARGGEKNKNRGMLGHVGCILFQFEINMLCLFKKKEKQHMLQDCFLTQDQWKLRLLYRHIVCCHFSRFEVLVTQIAAITSIRRALCWMQPWDLQFLVSDDCSLYVSLSFCWVTVEDGIVPFLNGFVVHDATQHYCVLYTRLCVRLGFRQRCEHNAPCTELTGLPFERQLGRFVQHSPRGETRLYTPPFCACRPVAMF